MTVHPGRFSAAVEGDFVVFLTGMRINKPMKIRSTLTSLTAMPS
jgi:hypothetical protein